MQGGLGEFTVEQDSAAIEEKSTMKGISALLRISLRGTGPVDCMRHAGPMRYKRSKIPIPDGLVREEGLCAGAAAAAAKLHQSHKSSLKMLK